MSWAALRRIVEAFFRRWPFYVALLIGALAFGYLNVSRTVDEYSATGSVFVDSDSLVTTQSGVQDGGFFSFLTPAQFTAQELNGLISTESFMEAVVGRAGVELDTEPSFRVSQIDGLRRSITSFATSENLVAVSVTTFDPELSFRLVNGVIEEFVQFQINIDIAESGASEEFFSELVEGYRQDLVDARDEVDATLRGVADLEELDPDQALELERLQAAEALASDRFRAALQNVEASRLATLQTETDVRQSYSVFDPPAIPTDPNGSLLDDLILLAVFGLAGLVLAMIGPIASAMLNRTVQFAEDLEDTAGVPVVAVLPAINAKQLRLDGAVVTDGAGDWGASGEALGRRTITFLPDEGDAESSAPTPKAMASSAPAKAEPTATAPTSTVPPEAAAPAAPAPPGAPAPPTAPAEPVQPPEAPAEPIDAAEQAEPAGPVEPPEAPAEPTEAAEADEREEASEPAATADPTASDERADAVQEVEDPSETKTMAWPVLPSPPAPAPLAGENESSRDPDEAELGEGVRAVETGETPSPTPDDDNDNEDIDQDDNDNEDIAAPLHELLATTDFSGQKPVEPPPPPGAGPPTANGKPTRQSHV